MELVVGLPDGITASRRQEDVLINHVLLLYKFHMVPLETPVN